MQRLLQRQIVTSAQYSAWSNERLYDAVATTLTDEYGDRPAADADELLDLLNALLITGRLWLARLRGYDPGIASMQDRMHDDFEELREAQLADDVELCDYVHGLAEEDMLRPIPYTNLEGSAHTNSQQELLLELFVGQIHTRGRLCEHLRKRGAREPTLDYLQFVRESGR